MQLYKLLKYAIYIRLRLRKSISYLYRFFFNLNNDFLYI